MGEITAWRVAARAMSLRLLKVCESGFSVISRHAEALAFGACIAVSLSGCEAINHDLLGDHFSPITNDPLTGGPDFKDLDSKEMACHGTRASRYLKPKKNGPQEAAPQYAMESICDDTDDRLLVVFAFSGGGFRSASFAFGALQAANQILLPAAKGAQGRVGTKLSDQIDIVTGASGGAFTAAAFASKGDKLFDEASPGLSFYAKDFLSHNFMGDLAAIYLEPWHWGWLLPDYGSNDEMAGMYGRIPDSDPLFAEDYNSLANKGRPFLVVQATDFGTEQPFTFTQNDFDLICSNLNDYPLRNALAAANGFPILFSPITLFNYRFRKPIDDRTWNKCPIQNPAWTDLSDRKTPTEISRPYERALIGHEYLDPASVDSAGPAVDYCGHSENDANSAAPPNAADNRVIENADPQSVHLQDGGVVDNLALRGLMNVMTQALNNLPPAKHYAKSCQHSGLAPLTRPYQGPAVWPTTDAKPICLAGLAKVTRIVVISVDGEAQPDNTVSSQPYLSSLGLIVNVLTSSTIDSNNYGTLSVADGMTKELKAALDTLKGCLNPALPDGEQRPSRDVKAIFAHVSFRDLAFGMDLMKIGTDSLPTAEHDQEACDWGKKELDQKRYCTVGKIARSGTSLHFSLDQIGALVRAGHDAFLCNPTIRQVFWPGSPGTLGIGSSGLSQGKLNLADPLYTTTPAPSLVNSGARVRAPIDRTYRCAENATFHLPSRRQPTNGTGSRSTQPSQRPTH